MCQFGSHTVLLAGAGSSQLLGNDKLGDVDTIAEEVRDNLLCIGEGILRGPVECNIGKIVLNQTGALHKSCSHLSMRSLCKQVLMRLATRGQLSRRTCTNTDYKGRPTSSESKFAHPLFLFPFFFTREQVMYLKCLYRRNSHSFNSFAVHLVIGLWPCEEESSIALLVDQ